MRLISTALLLLAPAARAHSPALPDKFLPLPLVSQAHGFSCGAAALLSTLSYWKRYEGPESSLYSLLDTTPKDGTEPPSIVEAAKKFGLKAAMKRHARLRDLHKALARGETVILDIQAWPDVKSARVPWRDEWENGHYVVLVGMDRWNAYVMDPSADGAYGWLPLTELLERWHDYEDRHGLRQVYERLAIFIGGTNPPKRGAAKPLVRVE